MKISELEVNQRNVNLKAEIVEIGDIREFNKFGKTGRVCTAVIKDDSGKINLSLWNDQIDKVKTGSKIEIQNGYVKEWQGEKQLSVGRFGKLEVIQ
jgi:replication factor A1